MINKEQQELINNTLDQIVLDVETSDLTAIEEFLKQIICQGLDVKYLIGYIKE